MACLRCGREAGDGQAFCENCLADMKKDPVEPNVVIQLPRGKTVVSGKKGPRRRGLSPEERVVILAKRVRRLWTCLIVSLIVSFGMGVVVFFLYSGKQYGIGQNYKTSSTVAPPTTAATVSTVEQQ